MHDQAGALTASADLIALLRLCEALGERIPRSPTLNLARVQRIEEELGCALPDDVLVVLAVRSPMLECATSLSLEDILEVGDDVWSRGVPDDHVAIAAVYHEPFAERYEGAHGGPFDVISIPRTPTPASSILVVNDGRPAEEPTTLAAFAREKIEDWYRRREDWIRSVELAAQPWERKFEPRLTGAPAAKPSAAERWVTHPKLGRGKLLEVRDDKWTVEFASGTKVLKASVLVLEEVASAAPPPAPAPSPPRVSPARSHPLWPVFVERLARAGVDATRGFFEQADQSKGHGAEGHDYRRRDADARVKTTLRLVAELTGVKLPSSFRYDDSASESWRSPEDCFDSATRR
jgi:hypothetical protein